MEATELLDQAYDKWKVVDAYCRGYFNLAMENTGKAKCKKLKLEDATLTGLEENTPDEWFDKKHNQTFLSSVKTLRQFHPNIIDNFTKAQSKLDTTEFPKWSYAWSHDVQIVDMASNVQLWSFGYQIIVTDPYNNAYRDPGVIAGNILGSLKSVKFKDNAKNCRDHLLQNEQWVKEFFESTRNRIESVRKPNIVADSNQQTGAFFSMEAILKHAGFKDIKAIDKRIALAGLTTIDGGNVAGLDKRTRGLFKPEMITLLKSLADDSSATIAKVPQESLNEMLQTSEHSTQQAK